MAGELQKELREVNSFQAPYANDVVLKRCHAAADALDAAERALERAKHFIVNGVALGFIRMPDADTPDPAHETLPAVNAALAKLRGEA